MEVKGTVDSVYSITKNTRSGDKTIWYGDVDGTTVNLGFNAIWEEGEYVTVNVEEKYGELQIVGSGPKKKSGGSWPKTAPKAAPKGGYSAPSKGRNAGGFPINPTDSQVSIIRQSSLNRAVDVAGTLVANGMASAGTQEEYMDLIWELAYAFTDFGTGQREVRAAKHKEVQKAALEAVNG